MKGFLFIGFFFFHAISSWGQSQKISNDSLAAIKADGAAKQYGLNSVQVQSWRNVELNFLNGLDSMRIALRSSLTTEQRRMILTNLYQRYENGINSLLNVEQREKKLNRDKSVKDSAEAKLKLFHIPYSKL